MSAINDENKEVIKKIEKIQHNFLLEIQKIKEDRDIKIKSIIKKSDKEKIAAITKHIKII